MPDLTAMTKQHARKAKLSDFGNCTEVESVKYGDLGTRKKCPHYQGVPIFQVILYEKVLDYAGFHIFKCPHLQVSLHYVNDIQTDIF